MQKTTYSNKRSATRKKIDRVFIEHFRSTNGTDLTVKEICEKADINRSTFYTYYKDTDDMRNQIEDRLVRQFEQRMTPVGAQYLDDPDKLLFTIMEFNRENDFLPLLLIAAGSGSFVHRISDTVAEILIKARGLADDDRDKITMLFTYHIAGISMVIRQIMGRSIMSDDRGEAYENTLKKLVEYLLPVVKNGLLPTLKDIC
ncbi:MAG: TetR/AcrR family transcriptional regulator [Firmicutes bacterium]|nr:TetR/AcrR family transcriptional regulator [Bacillota bacterium]